jgi:hypothetical protein
MQASSEQEPAHCLRCLGQLWLKFVWRMWIDHVPYEEALHMMNMVRHGSWTIG